MRAAIPGLSVEIDPATFSLTIQGLDKHPRTSGPPQFELDGKAASIASVRAVDGGFEAQRADGPSSPFAG